MTRRLLGLFLSGRRTTTALTVTAAIVVVLRVTQPWTRGQDGLPQLLPLLLDVAVAAVIGACCQSPFGEPERATTPLPWLRLTHVTLLVAFACAALTLAQPDDLGVAVRNAVGLAGIALLAAVVTGGALSWTVPLGYVVYCAGAMDLHTTSLWSWPALAATDRTATVIAVSFLVAGALAMAVRGARDRA
ncbi:MAG TPA: hypothetical protein VHF06_14855 [Pseudonocardiaceae bacterium]|jgi:hypothetical protein|nr:hypothetical protein [Pseudonocardiaceae bacterium]